MFDVVGNAAVGAFLSPYGGLISSAAAPAEPALLARQTQALEFLALQLGRLTARVGDHEVEQSLELQPDYELATRRLLQEAV